jgi:hypothetical protein
MRAGGAARPRSIPGTQGAADPASIFPSDPSCRIRQKAPDRKIIYHNITPPIFSRFNAEVERRCARVQLKQLAPFQMALGVSILTAELEGRPPTGVLPIFWISTSIICPRRKVPNNSSGTGPQYPACGRIVPEVIEDLIKSFISSKACSRQPPAAGGHGQRF